MHFSKLGALLCTVVLAACSPQIAYTPEVKEASAPAPVVGAAIELRNAVEVEKFVNESGAVTLGEIRLTDDQALQLGVRNDPSHFTERAAAEAAARGGTHFYVKGFDDRHFLGAADDLVVIRYTVYRVEPGGWAKLEPRLRPERVASSR